MDGDAISHKTIGNKSIVVFCRERTGRDAIYPKNIGSINEPMFLLEKKDGEDAIFS